MAERRVEQPAAFIAGALDPVLRFVPGVDTVELMRKHVTDLRLVRLVEDCGHWVQQERPAEVNAALLEFLRLLDLKTGGRGAAPPCEPWLPEAVELLGAA